MSVSGAVNWAVLVLAIIVSFGTGFLLGSIIMLQQRLWKLPMAHDDPEHDASQDAPLERRRPTRARHEQDLALRHPEPPL